MLERTHTGKLVKKTSGDRSDKAMRAWKNSPYASESSRLGLDVLYWLVKLKYYGDINLEAHFRPKEIKWSEIKNHLDKCFPELKANLKFRDGSPAGYTEAVLSGRWHNFFHVWGKNNATTWSPKDSENPHKHPELQPLMLKARKIVEDYYARIRL